MAGKPITISHLNVRIGDRNILKDISVSIPPNKITAIIGPSGCGKSTMLKCMNRMIDLVEEIDIEGDVHIDGENIYGSGIDVSLLRKKVGMIAQTPNPLPMSIYDNIAYGPRIHGQRKRTDLDEIVERCLNTVGLWSEVKERLEDPAAKLSIGQQQRLCLARALAVQPEVLLCDEVTSSLDPVSAKHIETELSSLKNDYTIVFVTHILRQAKRLADYVIFLYLGELVEYGPANEVFFHPKDPRTAAYIEGVFG
ncbi:MAG: phosphate ABC transporter ATP-binding protein [Methanoregulaceae archaeon]|nr:phosphate ABC transporter ATP-binding protein [Methanoregulaceae archaeon]